MQRLGPLPLLLLLLPGGCHALWPLSAPGGDGPGSREGAVLDRSVPLEGGLVKDAQGPQLEGGLVKDAQGPQLEGSVSCSPMDAKGIGQCKMVIGVAWTGKACVILTGCSCSGTDCGSLFPTVAKCEEICL